MDVSPFRDIDAFSFKTTCFLHPTLFWHLCSGEPLRISWIHLPKKTREIGLLHGEKFTIL